MQELKKIIDSGDFLTKACTSNTQRNRVDRQMIQRLEDLKRRRKAELEDRKADLADYVRSAGEDPSRDTLAVQFAAERKRAEADQLENVIVQAAMVQIVLRERIQRRKGIR